MGSLFSRPPAPPAVQVLSPVKVKVVTYNILAVSYQHFHTYVPKKYLDFSYRRKKIVEFLTEVQDADFVCLQEVDHFEDYYEKVIRNLGFKVCYAQRPGNMWDGTLVAWKSAEWMPCFLERLDFDKCPEAESSRDYIRHNVGVLGLFSNRAGEKLLVASAHFYWDPQYEDVKVAQARFLLSKVQSTVALATLGVVITGDFNAKPDSAPYRSLIDGSQARGFALESAYYRDGRHPPVTNYTQNFQGTLDYILHSRDFKVVEVRPLPSEEECKQEIALPNSKHGSDHLPLVAVLQRLS